MSISGFFEWLKKHKGLLAIIGFILFWWNFTYILTQFIWAMKNTSMLNLLHETIRKFAIPILFTGIIFYHLYPELKKLNKIFNWKLWAGIFGCIILYGCIGWVMTYLSGGWNQSGEWFDTRFAIGDYEWSYLPIIQYSIFFVVQLYIWQKKGLSNYVSWTLSFMGCYLVSQFYEMAWFTIWNMWATLQYQVFQTFLFVVLLLAIGWRPKKIQLLPLLFLIGFWITVFLQPTFNFWHSYFWLPRFAPMPFFISFALVWKGQLHE